MPEIFRYNYVPKEIIITLDKDYKFRDGSITYMNVIHDYVGRILPVIQLAIEVETELIDKFYQYKDTGKFKFDIIEEQWSMAHDDQETKLVGTTLYMRHTFSYIPARDQVVYITTPDPEVEEYTNELKKLQRFEVYLIDVDHVNRLVQEIDLLLEEADYAEMLKALFIKREIPPDVVIATPPVQSGLLKNITLPLGDLVHNIEHYNQSYGLYPVTPIIYHDTEEMYCIDRKTPNIKIPSATDYGTVMMVLFSPRDPKHHIPGSYDDAENEQHVINLNVEPSIFDDSTRDTYAKMSTITTVDSKGKVKKTTIDEKAAKLRYIYANNALTQEQFKNANITGPTVGVIALNSSVKFLKPYKDYRFDLDKTYDNLNLNKRLFRLLGWTLGIMREGNAEYTSEVILTLYQPEQDPKEEQ